MSTEKSKPVTRAEITSTEVLVAISKLDVLQGERKILDLRRDALTKRLEKAQLELIECCQHETVGEHSSYYGGSYDDVARTYYTHKCNICGVTLNSWTKFHDYYG